MLSGTSFRGVSCSESGVLVNMVCSRRTCSQVSSTRSNVIDVFSIDVSLVLVERLILPHVFLEGLLLLNEQSVIEVDDVRCHFQALIIILLVCKEVVDVVPLINGIFEAFLKELILCPDVVKFRIFKFKVVLTAFLIYPRIAISFIRHGIEILVLIFLYLSFECVFEVIFVVVIPVSLLGIRE